MGVIEDSRKLVQDFLAPELRAISVRVEALEKKVDEVDGRAEKRHVVALAKIDDVERRAEKRHAEVLGIIGDLERRTDKRFEQVDKRFEQVDKRFEQIDKRFEQVDKRFEQVDKRFEQMGAHFDTRFDQLLAAIGTIADYNALRERVARLETGDRPHQ